MTAHNTNLVLVPHTANDWIDPRIVRSVRRVRLSDGTMTRAQELGHTDYKLWNVVVSIDGWTQPSQAGLKEYLYYFDTEEQADEAIAAIVGQND